MARFYRDLAFVPIPYRRSRNEDEHIERKGTEMNTYTQRVVDAQSALEIVTFAIREGGRIGVRCSVTVVGPSMELVAFGKADGATPHSVDSSRRKANTAASTRRDTGWMPESLALPLPWRPSSRQPTSVVARRCSPRTESSAVSESPAAHPTRMPRSPPQRSPSRAACPPRHTERKQT